MISRLLAIVGPTASGKTTLGLRLAAEQNGEIVSVDSRQVYRHLAVGTAKPSGKWEASPGLRPPSPDGRGVGGEVAVYVVEGVPYHLVDIAEPDEIFSAARFVGEAKAVIDNIQRRDRKPILVGGTGLYFKALTEGLAPLPPADATLRGRLKKEADEKGRPRLHHKLAVIDPEAAQKIPANNIQRVIRALEVFELTGKPISKWHEEHRAEKPVLQLQMIGLDPGKEELHRRIEARCRAMLDHGMIEETGDLLNRGYKADSPSLTGLGYPRIVTYLEGRLSKDELLTLLIRDTRQYAKRQLTWFRHQAEVEWKTS